MDEDIKYNLEIANGFITDKIEPIEKVFFVEWWESISASFSTSFWAIIFLSLLGLMVTLFAFFFMAINPKIRQLGLLGGGSVMAGALIVMMLANTSAAMMQREEAIVFASSVNVKSEPGLNGTDQFVIHAGIKVSIEDVEGDWIRIRIADGNSGWLLGQSIERI